MVLRVRLPARFATVLSALALAGCGGGGDAVVDDPAACFPADARGWLARDAAPAAKPAAKDAPARPPVSDRATIYVDRSGSMGGYLAGATAAERPLEDLIDSLPTRLEGEGMKTGLAAFGTRIAPQPDGAAARDRLMQPGFYSCKGAAGADCDNRESRFDLVFEDIRRKPADMALVVSDLWFVNSQVRTSALTDLAAPIGAILADGRAVAVYGIPARFAGPIYDLPDGSPPMPFTGRHPLFLIAVGTDAQIDRFHELMTRAWSPDLAARIADGSIRRTVFTLDPRASGAVAPEPLKGNDPAVTRTTVLDSLTGIHIQQFQIAKSAALRAKPGGAGLSWTGPAPAAFRPDTVWAGTLEGRTRVWERRGDPCAPGGWIESRSVPGLWRPAGGGQVQFRLDPRAVTTGIGRPGTYLLAGEVHRTALLTPAPASGWMRAWSFSPGQDPHGRTMAGSPFFPTLHLGEVARLMENALADAARRKSGPVAGFATVVKVTD